MESRKLDYGFQGAGYEGMQPMLSLVNRLNTSTQFDQIRIKIASPEEIRSWSFGEVKKPETINYRTFKPEKDGLFCARIFGPIKDYECLCGKYKRMKYRGVVCERCGVEVTLTRVRRERMGHIELACPVAHIWFARSLPSRIGTLLDLNTKAMDRILYFEGYVVLDPGMTALHYGKVLGEDEYMKACQEYGPGNFVVGSGAQALKEMLIALDLAELRHQLRDQLDGGVSELKRKKIIKRLKLVEAFLSSGTRPEWMILDVVPVMPPELRPLVPLDGGRFATSDLNDLYRRLLNRNNRLKRLLEMGAPEIIVRNEKRMLQEMVDAFFDNGRRGRPILGSNKRPLKSMSDMLRGKQGRFRLNLLGKRVDYSGRSVIVVGPELKLHQCGLPKKMALELFKPYVYARLERYGLASTIKMAKRMVEQEKPEVWGILEEVIKERTVLLNRAPTLHRLSIQAFEPILVEGKAIQLHPLVCASYNADFDGDQMAVHVPLSLEAQIESRVLMMSTNNILSPASGEPVIVPSKDMVLGLYHLTLCREGSKGEGRSFATFEEALVALETEQISLNTRILVRMTNKEFGHNLEEEGYQRVETTVGRLIFWEAVPKIDGITFDLANCKLKSKDVGKIVGLVHRLGGACATTLFLDRLVQLGFKYATVGGISIGKDDLLVPEQKQALIKETTAQVIEYHQQFLDGLITVGERYNRVTDAWTKCTEQVTELMEANLSKEVAGKPLNSLYMMFDSGARGSVAQMRQLSGMRGLITRHDGSIVEHPITANFKEGLEPDEYFNSIYGSRKGLSDTALKTASAGYLTRRLVDVAQDCVVRMHDCGTDQFTTMTVAEDSSGVEASLREKILGRVLAQDLTLSNNRVIKAGSLLAEEQVCAIEDDEIASVPVRSVLTCTTKDGVCSMCYGLDLARGHLVVPGEAVGVIAAQSIGEPGTQLTLKTFHTGGASLHASEASYLEARHDGVLDFRHENVVENRHGHLIVLGRSMEIVVLDKEGKELMVSRVPHGSSILVRKGEAVAAGQKLAEWDPYTLPIIAEQEGKVQYVDLIEGVSFQETVDEVTGITQRTVIAARSTLKGVELRPTLMIALDADRKGTGGRYFLGVDSVIMVNNGEDVKRGDVLARLAKEAFKSKDIVGGLPRIVELFEARRPKDPSVMSPFDGVIEFGKDYKSRRRFSVIPHDPNEKPVEYTISKDRHVLVQEGDVVRKGDFLVDGNIVPHDILVILGFEALSKYFVTSVQDLYRLQGVPINAKHVEVILKQMMQRVEVVDPGHTLFLIGDHVTVEELEAANAEIRHAGKKPAIGVRILQGITKVSLQTDSFISAASFQETTRALIDAAVYGKVDKLKGLKENVIVGRLIPAGTGFIKRILRQEARQQDQKLLEDSREKTLSEAQ